MLDDSKISIETMFFEERILILPSVFDNAGQARISSPRIKYSND
jgi:hypothetical protein